MKRRFTYKGHEVELWYGITDFYIWIDGVMVKKTCETDPEPVAKWLIDSCYDQLHDEHLL
jgi:hypothetical protein